MIRKESHNAVTVLGGSPTHKTAHAYAQRERNRMEHAFTIRALFFLLSIFPYDFPRKIPLIRVGPIQTDSRLEKRHRDTHIQRARQTLTFFILCLGPFLGVKGFWTEPFLCPLYQISQGENCRFLCLSFFLFFFSARQWSSVSTLRGLKVLQNNIWLRRDLLLIQTTRVILI